MDIRKRMAKGKTTMIQKKDPPQQLRKDNVSAHDEKIYCLLDSHRLFPEEKKTMLQKNLIFFFFLHLHKNENVALSGYVTSTETSKNRTGQCLVNTVDMGRTFYLEVSK